mmetsp:Transcript_8460/g.26310  ORF Transcript_8460/g.26310 Transcript_8460/m.26310 type:complete len:610 (-) Transcript_8460:214-2043(-)
MLPLVLLGAVGVVAAAGGSLATNVTDETASAAEECPHGYYRTAAIIFGCHGSNGASHYLLAPAATTTVVNIPAGVQNFSVQATSDLSIGLKLADPASRSYIVNSNSKRSGVINNRQHSGTYQGVHIHFSSDVVHTPVTENLQTFGAFPVPTELRFKNRDSSWGDVALNFSHGGLESCPVVPAGCSVYNEIATKEDVVSWSRWARSEFSDAGEAWLVRGAPHATSASGGILWHSWPAVWVKSLVEPASFSGNEWQPAFHYIDADHNGEVSQAEFEAGYDAAAPRSSTVAAPSSTTEAFGTEDPSTWPAPPEVGLKAWVDEHGGYLLGGLGTILGILICISVFILCPSNAGYKRKRKRGVRMVRSRDADGVLELGDEGAESYADQAPEASAISKDSATISKASRLEESGSWPPGPVLPVIGSFWGMPLPSGFWPLQDSFRYGPVPTAADERGASASLMPSQVLQPVQGAPGQPWGMQRSPSMTSGRESSASFHLPASRASFAPMHPLAAASRESLDAMWAAPKAHVVERSHSFTSAAGQAHSLPSFSGVDTTSGSHLATQVQAPGSHRPWAAVFTPEEWARTTQLVQQRQQLLQQNQQVPVQVEVMPAAPN